MNAFNREIKPLRVGLVQCILETLKVIAPVWQGRGILVLQPSFVLWSLQPLLNLISWVVLGPREGEILVSVNWIRKHYFQVFHLNGDKDSDSEQSKRADG